MEQLKIEIDELRLKMIVLYEQIGDFTDSRVVQISQELDELLNDLAQREKPI
ncbi:Spo0E family sporulation regulatory protein-aspartic acid phosphatase [Bacillus piscicola]|uniref:Spo0E family sporulation regulatory protein-aspartic acid phosphatase n=1 Tax=Bacillus piscicola TaxID=1632684 RepID=UPI003B82F139